MRADLARALRTREHGWQRPRRKREVRKQPLLDASTPQRWISPFQVAQRPVLTPKICQNFDMDLPV
jgi:hypothetical protein